jgi:Domain of unknown function (DUF5666)
MQKNMSRGAGSASGGRKFLVILASVFMLVPSLALAQTAALPGHRLSLGLTGTHAAGGMNAFIKHSTNAAASVGTISGTVASAVSGQSISLTASNGTGYTVDATNAKILRKYGAAMAITDIQIGDSLVVRGTVSGTSVAAITIRDNSQQQANATFSGSVSSVNGASFVLATKNRGNQTINTTSTTIFKESGLTSVGMGNITVGENITTSGVWDSTSNTVAASKVTIVVKTGTISGTLTNISGTTLTVTASGTSLSVYTVDASNVKKVDRRYGASTDLSALQTGDTLSVRGVINGTNVTASTIRDISLQARKGTFVGTVSGAVNGSSFAIQSKDRGSQTINTTSSTIFKEGSAGSSLADIAVGQTVTVSGVWDRTNSNVTATRVTIKVGSLSVTGTLGSLSGSTFTVTTASSTVYSVDATNARVTYKNGHKGSVSILQNGDSVVVYGKSVSGSTNIIATLVRDTTRVYSAAPAATSQQ